MPRFYTLIVNDDSIEQDDDGQEFASADAAIANAERAAVDLLGQHLTSDVRSASLKLFVQDAHHHRVATISVMGSVTR